MALTKKEKQEVVEKVKAAVSGATTVVFSDFSGITAAETLSLRRALRQENVGYVVAKKTLAARALADVSVTGEVPPLTGQLGIAYGNDAVSPARVVYDFQKKLEGKVKIVGGIFEGRYVTAADMTAVAQIPSLPVLYGQLVNLINSPIQRFVIALDAIAKKGQ